LYLNSLCFYYYTHPLHLPSFPTRRSSDLGRGLCDLLHHFLLESNGRLRGVGHRILRPLHRGARARRFGGVVRRSRPRKRSGGFRSEEHTSELQSRENLVCRPLLEKKIKHSILLRTYTVTSPFKRNFLPLEDKCQRSAVRYF